MAYERFEYKNMPFKKNVNMFKAPYIATLHAANQEIMRYFPQKNKLSRGPTVNGSCACDTFCTKFKERSYLDGSFKF